MVPEWLNRSLIVGPYYTLCLSEDACLAEMKRLSWELTAGWAPKEGARVHYGQNEDGKLTCIVCMRGWEGKDPIEIAGLLIHESVHIWQQWAADVGEKSAGDETEAYAVQWLSQQLMYEFVRQTKEAAA